MTEKQPYNANTTIGTLRKTYGENFAPEFRSDDVLSLLLKSTGTASLAEYLEYSRRGVLVGTSSDVTNTVVSHTTAVFDTALRNLAKK